MAVQKILLVSHEMAPYTDITAQSEFLKELAINLQGLDAEIRVFMPKFGSIKERKHRLHEVIRLSGLNITIGRNNNPLIIKVASLQTAKIQVYFLDNEDFFKRKQYFDKDGKLFDDNAERSIFFNKGVLELLVKLGWIPDVIHCQGWFSGLIPYYARTMYKNEPALKNVKLIYSHMNDDINQKFDADFATKAHIDKEEAGQDYFKSPSSGSFYKIGAKYADQVVLTDDCQDEEREYVKRLGKDVLEIKNYEDPEIYEKYFELLNR